ncbi:MAG: L,D-transpeptidase family protein [Legionellales bacterium]|nr:L,D-transpeptidase family protein [Legionellales bacterium]
MYKQMIIKRFAQWLTLASFMLPALSFGLTFPLPPSGNDIVGEVKVVKTKPGDTLSDVARRYGVGIEEIREANPGVSRRSRIAGGRKIVIPSRFILPSGPRKGIVINLAEQRLYYFPTGQNIVITEPVGIGREGQWRTPTGTTQVTGKAKNPAWRPTANVRAEAARNGTPIPEYFPPGPDNPLGRHVLRLGWATYLIHGTNRPEGVGSRVSAGCIRMYPEDIAALYAMVPVGTPVRVVSEPFKVGWHNGHLYYEAHSQLVEDKRRFSTNMNLVVNAINNETGGRESMVQWSKVRRATRKADGIPEIISE